MNPNLRSINDVHVGMIVISRSGKRAQVIDTGRDTVCVAPVGSSFWHPVRWNRYGFEKFRALVVTIQDAEVQQ